jgi:hypothetical protein
MLKGKREGMLEGKEENQKRIVLAMIDAGKYSNEEISMLTQMPVTEIEFLGRSSE